MTIICFKDGIMAADGLSAAAGLVSTYKAQKLFRAHGALIGCAGDASLIQRFRRWCEGGGLTRHPRPGCQIDFDFGKATEDNFGAVAAWPDGRLVTIYFDGETYERPEPERPYAMGTGFEFAIGAMCAGLSAAAAVALVCGKYVSCGGTIQIEHVRPTPQEPLEISDELRDLFEDGTGVEATSWAEKQGLI